MSQFICKNSRLLGLGLGISLAFPGFFSLAETPFPPDPHRELIQMEAKPFWRKPKYFKKLENERAILVSVRSDKIEDTDRQNLHILGAGLVSRPIEDCYRILKDFGEWKQMSDYIRLSEYDPKTQIFNLHLEAFGYHARLKMRVFFDGKGDQLKALRFLVLEGGFKDMKGLLEFKDHERRKTEISMTVQDEFDKLPLPRFFLEFGLEVVFQKMAERMRSHIEKEIPR